jgi:gliding motility-associated-like protein
MIEKNKNQLLSLFGILLFSLSLSAQPNAYIIGPGQVCSGECATYTLYLDNNPGPFGEYFWTDGMGGFFVTNAPFYTACFNSPGIVPISVEGQTDSIVFNAIILVQVGQGVLPDIISVSGSNCPDNSPGQNCEKVCANSSATYTIPNTGGVSIEWEVQGAESYQVNGDLLTVNWGNPGSGLITATSSTSTNNPNPLQVFCGANPDNSNGGNPSGSVWTVVTGGTAPYSYQWSNGSTSPTLNFISPGQYCITVTDASGVSASCCAFVSESGCNNPISQPFFTAASATPESFCGACDGTVTVTLTGGGTGSYTYIWSDGQTTPSITNACSGFYGLTITDSNDCQYTTGAYVACYPNPGTTCISTTQLCVDIIEDPEAIIVSNPPVGGSGMIEICQGQTIFFGNASTNAEYYEWSSGTGLMSSAEEVSFTYPNGGIYEVKLIAKNECFCSDTTTIMVNVEFAEGPQIDCIGTICENETVTYTANANGCSIYNWTISSNGVIEAGGGTADDFITINWGAGPEGTIELSVTNCATAFCQTPTVAVIPILSNNAEIAGPAKVCRGDVTVYSITKWNGASYNWTVSSFGTIKSGQNSNEIVVQWQDGFPSQQQLVSVTYDNCFLECSGSDEQTVDILPEFFITGPIETCQNGNGTYFVKNVATNAFIMATFTLRAPDGSVVWTSGGITSNANVLFPSAIGTYTLEVTAAVPSTYCFDLASMKIKVLAAPDAPTGVNGPSLICPNEVFNYKVISPNPNNAFTWEINNGGSISSVNGPSINVTWGANPPYSLSVVETNTTGIACTSDPATFSAAAITNLAITGDDVVCVEETVVYTATSYEEVDYVWTITPEDAGTVVSGQNTNVIEVLWHADMVATLQVDMCGLSDQLAVNIHPFPLPIVNHPVGLCSGDLATLTTTIPYSSYSWKDENGVVVSTLASPALPAGTYELVVVNSFNCEGNSTFFIQEYPLPEITISSPDNTAFCTGDPVPTLYALNTDDGYTYQWMFNGSPTGGNTVSIVAATFGVYQLQITDNNGCENLSNPINVIEYCGPSANGTCSGGTCVLPNLCDPGTISFSISSTSLCPVSQYTNETIGYIPGSSFWDFGDPGSGVNNTSTLENPTHEFSEAGFFVVIMYADNNTGTNCYYAAVDTVPLVANFDVLTACAGSPTQFNELTTFLPLPFAQVTAYSWNFGDPSSGVNNTSTNQNPTHIFSNPGVYNVSLTSTNQDGCTSTRVKAVTVYAPPMVSFPQPAFNCEATPLEFTANASANVVDLLWNFGDPTSGAANEATTANTLHAYDAPGNYTVTLTATNIYGCSASFNNTITIDPNPLNGVIDYTSPICEGDMTTLTAPPGGTSWDWNTGETIGSIQQSEAGIYSVTMTNAMGCAYIPPSAILDIIPAPDGSILVTEFNEFGQPTELFFFDYSACEGESVYLSVIGQGNYSYQWSNGQGSTTVIYDNLHLGLLGVGTHEFVVTITDFSTGCTSEVGPYTVTINPLPTNVQITASPLPVCSPELTTLSVVNPQVGYTYLWSNGAVGVTTETGVAGLYSVTAITPFGCEGESNSIEIFPAPDVTLVPDGCHERCAPDEICLPVIPGVVSYQWYQDGVLVPAPEGTIMNYIVEESGFYQVLLTDGNGCTAISDGLTITITPTDSLMLDLSACTGEYATYQGNQLLAGSITPFQYQNQDGCDSIVIITVIENPTYNQSYNLETCDGTFITFGGMTFDAGTQTILQLQTYQGCDSIVDISVAAIPTFTTNLILETCEGETINYAGNELAPGDSYNIVLTSSLGCDSTVNVTVNPYPTFSFSTAVSGPVCFDTNDGFIVIENVIGSTGPYVYSTDGVSFIAADTLQALAGGQHTIYVQDDNGCMEETEASIGIIEPIQYILEEVVLECSRDSVVIRPFLISNYPNEVKWTWPDGGTDDQFAAYEPGQFVLRLDNQCETKEDIIDVRLQMDGRVDFIYVPNVFSPNGDGSNDYFTGFQADEISILEWDLRLFDRWGNTLYHTNDIHRGWNGVFEDKEMNPGVYVWMYKATVETCHRVLELSNSGDVTVLK